ncbi:unnamed protein product [Phaedon cochleariae]|uniref:Uncharacterized protein n=1 Tax=Phaedon cochleariae TaxID=80249 RepID=A0A9N9WZ95_PHACE|nr:unnamed protein product [Phaedon cochleariae]
MSDASKQDHHLHHHPHHRPFAASAFGLRHMEAYGALPAHILNHLQPQFLHPGLTLGSGGAFRPLASAFAPPKGLKVEAGAEGLGVFGSGRAEGLGVGVFSPGRADSCSPASASLSPPAQQGVKEESLDASMEEEGEGQSGRGGGESPGSQHEEGRGFRRRRARFGIQTVSLVVGGGIAVAAAALAATRGAHENSQQHVLTNCKLMRTISYTDEAVRQRTVVGKRRLFENNPNINKLSTGFQSRECQKHVAACVSTIGSLFGGGFNSNGTYTFSMPGLPPAAHALAKSSFLFDHGCRSASCRETKITVERVVRGSGASSIAVGVVCGGPAKGSATRLQRPFPPPPVPRRLKTSHDIFKRSTTYDNTAG